MDTMRWMIIAVLALTLQLRSAIATPSGWPWPGIYVDLGSLQLLGLVQSGIQVVLYKIVKLVTGVPEKNPVNSRLAVLCRQCERTWISFLSKAYTKSYNMLSRLIVK